MVRFFKLFQYLHLASCSDQPDYHSIHPPEVIFTARDANITIIQDICLLNTIYITVMIIGDIFTVLVCVQIMMPCNLAVLTLPTKMSPPPPYIAINFKPTMPYQILTSATITITTTFTITISNHCKKGPRLCSPALCPVTVYVQLIYFIDFSFALLFPHHFRHNISFITSEGRHSKKS